jgi:hypothetical protein
LNFFFLFFSFSTLLNHFSKPFLNQTFYTIFCKLYTIIFKDF